MNRYRCNEIVIMEQVCVSSVGGKSVNPVVFVFVFVIVFVFVFSLVLYLILEIIVSNLVNRAVVVRHNLVSYLIARCWVYSFSAICDFEDRHHMRSVS